MTTHHTSGPWIVEEGHVQRDSGGIRYWQISDGLDAIACNQFCYAGHDPETNLANAWLIAASPELLDLAYQYLSDLRYPPTGDSVQRRIERAEAIIAKATGA